MSPDTQTQNIPRLLSVQDLAQYLGVPVATCYRWRARGGGPRGVKVGRHVRYRLSDVNAWLDSNTDTAGPRSAMTPERPRRPVRGGGDGTSHGMLSQEQGTAQHLAEVAARLRAIMPLTDATVLDDLSAEDRLAGIRRLAGWAGVHLAVAREHGEAA